MDLIETFSDGVRGIFSDMIYDIAENGFKGMFANIYAGFQQLLFKMAVEYLASVLYQQLLGSLFSGFGLGGSSAGKGVGAGGNVTAPNLGLIEGFATGGYVSKNQVIQVGENGKELFVPFSDGYVIPNQFMDRMMGRGDSSVVNSIGGSSSMNRYSSSAYSVDNSMVNAGGSFVDSRSSNSNSQVVIINHNYYGSSDGKNASRKSTSQQILEAQKEMDRVGQRLG
jgi:hypothetical protein